MKRTKSLLKALLAQLAERLPQWVFLWMLSRYPLNAGLELINICNANCSFCAYRYLKRKKQAMSSETFEKALVFLSGTHPRSFNLTPTVGDPLLDTDLVNRVRSIHNRGFKDIFFYTNAIALGLHDITLLLSSGISRVAVSTILDGPEEYLRYYGVDKYTQAINNIRRLLNNNNLNNNNVQLTFHLRSPRKEIREMNPLGALLLQDLPVEKVDYLTEFKNWGKTILPDDIPKNTTLRTTRNFISQKTCCAELYRRIHVFADGSVGCCPCCDFEATLSFGTIDHGDAITLWRGDTLRKIRAAFERGSLPSVCKMCDDYRPVGAFINDNRLLILANYLANRLSLNI